MPNMNDNEQPEDIMNDTDSTMPNTETDTSTPETNLFEEPIHTDSAHPGDIQRKKAPKWLIPICAVLFLLIIAVTAVFCSPTLSNAFALLTMKPDAYFEKVETKNLSSKIDSFTKNYDSAKTQLSETYKNGMGMEQSITAKVDSSLTNMFGLSDLKSVGINSKAMYKDGNSQFDFSILVNDSEALLLNMYGDMNNGLFYYLVPSLNKAYLKMSMEEIMDTQYEEEFGYNLSDLTKFQKLMINPPFTGQFLNTTLKKYTQILTDNMNTVTVEKNVELKTNTISGKYTELNVTISSEEQYAIGEQILATLQEDSELSDILAKEDIVTTEKYNQVIGDALEQLRKGKDDFISKNEDIIMKVWVTNKGDIIGREFSATNNEVPSSFGYRSVQKKSDLGMELWVSSSSKEIMNIKSLGTKKNTAYTGNVDILFADPTTGIANTTKVAVDNFSIGLGNANMSGKLTFTNSALGIFSIVADFLGDGKTQNMNFGLMQGGTKLVSLLCTNKIVDYKDISFPSDTEEIYDGLTEMDKYLASSDLTGFITQLEEKINIEAFSNLLDNYLYY